MLPMRLPLLILALCLCTACSKQIPNTTVKDSSENRGVVNFLEKYRNAVEERDIGGLLAMAHPQYLDDNGTPGGEDDLDFQALQEKLGRWGERVSDVRYEIKYRTVSHQFDRILVEFRYSASYRLAHGEEGNRWSRRVGDHRIVLRHDEQADRYLVLSGM